MVPFGGWLMPVQYTSIMEEHQAVRKNVGVFDISHMGQFIVEGNGAGRWLNTMLTNNIEKLGVGQGQYTFLLNEKGGIIDDLIAYRTGDTKFLLVVNASRSDEDLARLKKQLRGDIKIESRSATFGALETQGPRIGTRCIYDEQEFRITGSVGDQIVDDSAFVVEQERVLPLSDPEFFDVVG